MDHQLHPIRAGASHARPHRRPYPELLTITEAAELLRTPVATLRFWRHRNIGRRGFRLGRRVLYRRDDLHAWITECHNERQSGRE